MVPDDQPERKVRISYPPEDVWLPDAGTAQGFDSDLDDHVQPQQPEADAGLSLCAAGRTQRSLYAGGWVKISKTNTFF